jgi:hypothetical protein
MLEVRAVLWTCAVAVRVLPFRWIAAALLGRATSPACRTASDGDRRRARAIGRVVAHYAARHRATRSCLVQALATRALLSRRGIRAETRVGVARAAGAAPTAHAWVLVGNEAVVGGGGADGFEPIADFEWR